MENENKELYLADKQEILLSQTATAGNKLIAVKEQLKVTSLDFVKKDYSFIKIKDQLTDPFLKLTLGCAFSEISVLGGFKNEITSENKHDIIKMLFSVFKELSIEEIYKAFELERYCQYEFKTEHFQLFNAEYISTILKKYKKWKQNIKITNNISIQQSKPEMTYLEKRDIMTNGIIQKFEYYKETGNIEPPFAHILEELIIRRVINVNRHPKVIEYYTSKYEQARNQLIDEFKNSVSESKLERIGIKKELENILNSNSEKIAIRQSRLVLKDFFDKQIANNIDFNQLINN